MYQEMNRRVTKTHRRPGEALHIGGIEVVIESVKGNRVHLRCRMPKHETLSTNEAAHQAEPATKQSYQKQFTGQITLDETVLEVQNAHVTLRCGEHLNLYLRLADYQEDFES